ncbi:MAG TPA: hypothetical protein VNW54_15075 [Granulicella sp.]|jgi:hypothetical protein|nr:hypothetical protein [Granulicella sp.]
MSAFDPTPRQHGIEPDSLRAAIRQIDSAATSARVNRTHRIVRERAHTIAARRSRVRSLFVPLLIFSALLIGICTAVWSVLDQYELEPNGSPVASYQMLVLLLWSVPVSAALMAVVWFRQSRITRDGEMSQ